MCSTQAVHLKGFLALCLKLECLLPAVALMMEVAEVTVRKLKFSAIAVVTAAIALCLSLPICTQLSPFFLQTDLAPWQSSLQEFVEWLETVQPENF